MIVITKSENVYVFWRNKYGRHYYGVTNIDSLIIHVMNTQALIQDLKKTKVKYNPIRTSIPKIGKALEIYVSDYRFEGIKTTSEVTAVYNNDF